MRDVTCCFTGHRPDKTALSEQEIYLLLEKAIDKAISDGFLRFISGMAMGVDVIAAEIVLERRKINPKISLICALPHPSFEKGRSAFEAERFRRIIKEADETVLVNKGYFAACYQLRNIWMVDRSCRVIAVFNGQKGGTKNTVDYANRNGVSVQNVLE